MTDTPSDKPAENASRKAIKIRSARYINSPERGRGKRKKEEKRGGGGKTLSHVE